MSKCSECGNSPCDCEVKPLSAEQIAQLCATDSGSAQRVWEVIQGSKKPEQRAKPKTIIRITKGVRRRKSDVQDIPNGCESCSECEGDIVEIKECENCKGEGFVERIEECCFCNNSFPLGKFKRCCRPNCSYSKSNFICKICFKMEKENQFKQEVPNAPWCESCRN